MCKHENTGLTADGRRAYCIDCGQRMEDPVRSSPYYRALEDGRRLRWRKVGAPGCVIELSKTYIGATFNPVNKIWILSRVRWCDDMGCLVYAQETTKPGEELGLRCPVEYIAEDVLGVPTLEGKGAGLSSNAA